MNISSQPLQSGISVVVPVYNSAPMLTELVRRLETTLKSMGLAFELILVNDGSRDDSWEVICALAACHPWVRGLRMMRNYGQHNALLAGVRAARHALTVTMDDDLQHPPEELPGLIAALSNDVDVIYAPAIREPHGLWRGWASRLTKLALQSALGADVARKVSAYRLMRTCLREAFAGYHGPYVSLDVVLTWATTRFKAVPVPHAQRAVGVSNYTLRHLVRHALTLMTGFSVWPLQLASLMGFAFTCFGIIVLVFVFTRFLIAGSSVAGFPFLASIIAIFSGAQMFALGIMGEYLARMHFRMMERPTYVIGAETPPLARQ